MKGLLILTLGGALANACGDPFSTCEAHRNCPPTGGSGGQGGEGGPNDTAGAGGDGSVDSGMAGGGAAAAITGGGNAMGGTGTVAGSGAGAVAGSNQAGATVANGGAKATEGGTAGNEGGTETGGESTAGAAGSAGSNAEGGSGGAADDPCDPNPCENKGTCAGAHGEAACACTKGYTGKHCDLLVFEGIGVIDGDSYAGGVSGDGTTIVGGGEKAGPITWTSQTGIQVLRRPNGYSTCLALGISSDGLVAVGSCSDGTRKALTRWVRGNAEILDPQGAAAGYANAANFDGSVVVGRLSGLPYRAFRWTNSAGIVEIPALSPGENTQAYGTSDDGNIVIGISGTLGFRWSIGSNPQNLGTRDCTPWAISADGLVIVGEMPSENGKSHAFRWTQSDGLVDLGILATDPETRVYDVSADGSVAVGESGPAELGEGLLWTKSAGLQPLKTVLASAGADLSGWQISTAWGVSANGKVIVGWGTHDAHTEGWIARLP